MAEATVLAITTAVGRLVSGSLYEQRTTDYEGNPKVVKSGPNAGQPNPTYDFSIAVKKTPGVAHWASETIKALVNGVAGDMFPAIWALGHAEFPAQAQRSDFSWKIDDGDSAIPNKKGNKNCDKEGWAGHWIIHFSNRNAPKLLDYLHSQGNLLTESDAIKRGYFVQVMCEFKSNAPSASPGLFANHQAVALIAYGPVMKGGGEVDVSKAGFGQGIALPEGATTVPPAGTGATPPPPAAPAPAPPAPVTPAHDLVQNGPVMTAKAAGVPYADFIAKNWTDAALREHGYIV